MTEIEEAKETLRIAGYFVDNLWNWKDVDIVCEEEGIPELKRSEIIEFFKYLGRQHDAEIGINWESLGSHLKEYLKLKKT